MQRRADSIAPCGAVSTALLRACFRVGLAILLGMAPSARAQAPKTLAAQLVYSAPATCPRQAELERRLRARLHGFVLKTSTGSSRLEIRIEQRGRVHGSIVLSNAERVLGQRDIEASQCDEAVDALAFIAALLLEEGARANTNAGRQDPGTTSTDNEPVPERGLDERGTSTPTGAGEQTDLADAEVRVATPPVGAANLAAPAPPREGPAVAPTVGATPAASSDSAPARGARASQPMREQRALGASLQVALALVSGVAPSVRPGLAANAGLTLVGNARVALQFSLGMRAILPQQVGSPDGAGRFAWWSSAGLLCGALQTGPKLSAAICATAELGRLIARGLETDAAVTRRTRWLAFGPTARVSVRLVGPLSLEPAFGLLLPTSQDRFIVGASELHAVPRLTFRGELGLRIRFE